MRSRFIALAAAAALFSSQVLAAPVYLPTAPKTLGNNVAAVDQDGNTVRAIAPIVSLTDATGAAIGTSGNPLITTPATGATSTVTQPTAANLNAQVQGAGANGAALVGNPVLIAGSDGTNTRSVSVNSAGFVNIQGLSSNGSAPGANGIIIGGSDGTNFRYLRTDANGSVVTGRISPGTSITAASGNVANASAVATLAGAASKTTWISGFQCSASGATAASVVNLTVAGVITGTMTYTFGFPAGVTTMATPMIVNFASPVPASAANTAVVVTLPAGGSGNTNAACSAQGFQL